MNDTNDMNDIILLDNVIDRSVSTFNVGNIRNTKNTRNIREIDLDEIHIAGKPLDINMEVNVDLSVDSIYNKVKDILRGFDLKIDNIGFLVQKVFETVRGTKLVEKTIDEKRQLILDVCNKFLEQDFVMSTEDKICGRMTINSIIDTIMNTNLKKTLYTKKNKIKDNVSPGIIIDSIVDKIETIIVNKQYSIDDVISNISSIVGMVVAFVEKYNNLDGIEKKNIVVQALTRFLKDRLPKIVDITSEMKIILDITITTLPTIIDTIVAISRGKSIKDTTKMCFIKLIPQCISLLRKNV
jgi:hypothetical protein